MWESDTLRAGPAGPGRSEDGMSGKRKKGSEKAAPRAYGRLTRHERDTVQRMLERRASCREIARELGRSPSTVSAEVASHRFVTAPKPRRGERVDGVSVNIIFTVFTNVFSPIAPTWMRRIRQRGCAAFGV